MYYDCPVEDFLCPYFDTEKGMCAMQAVGDGDPHEECDAWYENWDDEEEEEEAE